jgi:hypothetical protein
MDGHTNIQTDGKANIQTVGNTNIQRDGKANIQTIGITHR